MINELGTNSFVLDILPPGTFSHNHWCGYLPESLVKFGALEFWHVYFKMVRWPTLNFWSILRICKPFNIYMSVNMVTYVLWNGMHLT